SRAPTKRKWRGRKCSSVRPSRYWSTTAGLTYDARATAGVLPNFSPTVRMTAASVRFGLRFGLGRALFREGDRCEQGAAPRAEVLRAELFVQEGPDVLVQPARRQVDELALVVVVAKETSAAGELLELAERVGEVAVDQRRSHPDAPFPRVR